MVRFGRRSCSSKLSLRCQFRAVRRISNAFCVHRRYYADVRALTVNHPKLFSNSVNQFCVSRPERNVRYCTVKRINDIRPVYESIRVFAEILDQSVIQPFTTNVRRNRKSERFAAAERKWKKHRRALFRNFPNIDISLQSGCNDFGGFFFS